MSTEHPWRSLFFAPANRHDLLAKFRRFHADNYVIDLEDGTPADLKQSARAELGAAVAAARREKLSGRLLVRINAMSGPDGPQDLLAALGCDIDGLVLPKLEHSRQLMPIDTAIASTGRSLVIVGGIESIGGVLNAVECMRGSASLRAVYFGAEDLATEMGGRRTSDGEETLYARQHVLLAAKAARLAAIDQAVLDIHDDSLFERDCRRATNFGYEGKICLNPRQVDLANRLFAPTAEEVERARRLLAAAAEGAADGRGTLAFEGQMIDVPLIERARALVAVSERLG